MSISQTKVRDPPHTHPWRSTSRQGYKGRMKNWTERHSRGSLSKWSIFLPSPPPSLPNAAQWLCMSEALSIGQWRWKGEILKRDGTNIFHYKSLNTNWEEEQHGSHFISLCIFLFLGITGVKPHTHTFFFCCWPIEIYLVCAEWWVNITLL